MTAMVIEVLLGVGGFHVDRGAEMTMVNTGIKMFIIQSHLYIRRGNRWLLLAALPGLLAASRGVKLPLLADTRSVFQSL